MRQLSNTLRPGTPYDADKRPFPKTVHLVTGMAVQWADGDDCANAAVSAAAVFVPVRRTRATTVHPRTLHFGFVAAVAESAADTGAVLGFADRILVQARREAVGLAWHALPDDLYLTMTAFGTGRLPGFAAVGVAWRDRTVRERGVAQLVDTAADLGLYVLSTQAAIDHGLHLDENLTSLQDAGVIQRHFDLITQDPEGAEDAEPVQHLAAGILGQALSVALLGGKALDRLSWVRPFPVAGALESEAWPVLPTALGSARQRPSGHPLADRPGSLPAPSRAVRKQT